ncbi:MAG: hypothetical protein KDI55_25255 [Anaerolineae bacterium]|nr:hypothetical protein [Anaerolineae bacterium]
MALIDRLAGLGDPEANQKLSVNAFHSAMYELAAGVVTKAQVVSYFELDASEEAELDWLIGRYNAQPNAAAKERFIELLRVVFILAEAQVPGYTTNAALVARLTL